MSNHRERGTADCGVWEVLSKEEWQRPLQNQKNLPRKEVETTFWIPLGSRSVEGETEGEKSHSFSAGLFSLRVAGPAAIVAIATAVFLLLSLPWWGNCLLALLGGLLVAICGSVKKIEDPSRATSHIAQLHLLSFKGEFKLRKPHIFLNFLWQGSSKMRTFCVFISPMELGNAWLWWNGYNNLLDHPAYWAYQALMGFLAWRTAQKIHKI